MRKRTAVALGATALVAGLVATGGVAATALNAPAPVPTRTAAATRPVVSKAPVVAPSPSRTATPTPTPKPAVQRTCSVAAAARDPRLAHFQGRVLNARTGEVLFSRDGRRPARAASVMKVLTAAAALEVLGADHRFTTRVVEGSRKGEIVLIGGGDVTLSRTPTGTRTAYSGAPRLSTLADRTKAAWKARHPGVPITRIVLDTSAWSGPSWQPTWAVKERRLGSTPKMTALMVDGDRANPAANTSRRSEDPVGRAGSAFADHFGGIATVRGTAPRDAHRLASVKSQPVSTLVQQALLFSDNAVAEALGRASRSGRARGAASRRRTPRSAADCAPTASSRRASVRSTARGSATTTGSRRRT